MLLALGVFWAAHSTAQAAADCQPVFDAYEAQFKAPAMKKTIKTQGMKDLVEFILTQDAMYSRVGAADPWSKMPVSAQVRALMKQKMPSPKTVTDCRKIGAQQLDGVAVTAYEISPNAASGNVPGEKKTVFIDDKSGLPIAETMLKAGTEMKIVYEGVAAPIP
ncbi:hypothetical protein [Rhizobium sp. C4]|uniref:hypothetical protein n=1 Tax=Rhizobium sp. C4 TaxID=1349800 RepID=UPI001E387EAE|nr:hypothetical protein [Rhizobium sp. C4]MCD2171985.1 hypothetical protein [Rhizobium sp. C4]